MGWYRQYLVVVFGPNRRNLLTVAALGLLFGVGYLVAPAAGASDSTVAGIRYAMWLVVFCVWMVWFVVAGVAVWRVGDFGEGD